MGEATNTCCGREQDKKEPIQGENRNHGDSKSSSSEKPSSSGNGLQAQNSSNGGQKTGGVSPPKSQSQPQTSIRVTSSPSPNNSLSSKSCHLNPAKEGGESKGGGQGGGGCQQPPGNPISEGGQSSSSPFRLSVVCGHYKKDGGRPRFAYIHHRQGYTAVLDIASLTFLCKPRLLFKYQISI